MQNTTYHRATSVADAAAKLSASSDGKLLAGGQTLIPTMKQRLADPSDIIDLRHVAELRSVTVDGNEIIIGAGMTHGEVAMNMEIEALCPAVCALAGNIGDAHVRHMGTIGGSIANNDPAADYPAAAMALNAQIKTNNRTIDADDFFTGMFETALDDGEIITGVSFAAPAKAAYVKFANPASRYAMVGVFVAKLKNGMARVAVTGAGSDGVFRHTDMEDKLTSDFSSAAIDGCTTDTSMLMTDMHADADYRASLITTMAKRAVDKANG